ncbi:hypothetical protein [Bacteroides sp.]|uniref:hypothetical protein n=1 Tax=Bacteroides sp. TaxID=29523 RepID=UPI0026304734|nr:hypothetical protein [Bacteroides sp.]
MNEELADSTGLTPTPGNKKQEKQDKDNGKANKKGSTKSEYLPIFESWKWAIPILIGLFLIVGIYMVYFTTQNFSLYYPTSGRLYLMTLHSVIAVVVFICLCVAILKLIAIYAKNMEREREILANLYLEEQQRLIVRLDKAKDAEKNEKDELKDARNTIKNLKETEEAQKDLIEKLQNMNEREYEKTALIKFQKEKIEYLEKINKQLLEKDIIIK